MARPGLHDLRGRGASDGGNIFLNPYNEASTEQGCWCNFCHSTTRGFAEETICGLKKRFRFRMDPCGADNKFTCQIICASAILRNFCTTHKDDFSFSCSVSPDWSKLFATYKQHRCLDCRRREAAHCLHQANVRNGAVQLAFGEYLWEQLLDDAPSVCLRLNEDDDCMLASSVASSMAEAISSLRAEMQCHVVLSVQRQ